MKTNDKLLADILVNGRKELTYEEVIEIIKDLSDRGYKSYRKAKEIAIEALERQIDKKPVYGDYDDNGDGEIIPCTAKCPSCGYEFEFGSWNEEENHHCPCGQKIDWE